MIYILQTHRPASGFLPCQIGTALEIRRERRHLAERVRLARVAAPAQYQARPDLLFCGLSALNLSVVAAIPGNEQGSAALRDRFASIAIRSSDRIGGHRTGPMFALKLPPESDPRWFLAGFLPQMSPDMLGAIEEFRAFIAEPRPPWDGADSELLGVKGRGAAVRAEPPPVKVSRGIRRVRA